MPWVVEYEAVRERMEATGRQCVYHNSGAFDFPPGPGRQVRGWIGGNDSTIRPEMRPFARNVEPPVESNLARRAVEAWQTLAPGRSGSCQRAIGRMNWIMAAGIGLVLCWNMPASMPGCSGGA